MNIAITIQERGLEDNYRKVNELVLCTALLVEETEGQTEQEQ